MRELTFYRQQRRDGGVRMGIDLNGGRTLFADFQEGAAELQGDPLGSALTWYVDLRCRGDDLPTEPEEARKWFLGQLDVIRDGLARLAEILFAGKDDSFPISWKEFPGAPAGVEIEAVCSTIRRLTGHDLARILREIGANLGGYLRGMPRPELIAR